MINLCVIISWVVSTIAQCVCGDLYLCAFKHIRRFWVAVCGEFVSRDFPKEIFVPRPANYCTRLERCRPCCFPSLGVIIISKVSSARPRHRDPQPSLSLPSPWPIDTLNLPNRVLHSTRVKHASHNERTPPTSPRPRLPPRHHLSHLVPPNRSASMATQPPSHHHQPRQIWPHRHSLPQHGRPLYPPRSRSLPLPLVRRCRPDPAWPFTKLPRPPHLPPPHAQNPKTIRRNRRRQSHTSLVGASSHRDV